MMSAGATILLIILTSVIEVLAFWSRSIKLIAVFVVLGFVLGVLGDPLLADIAKDMVILMMFFALASQKFITTSTDNNGDANVHKG